MTQINNCDIYRAVEYLDGGRDVSIGLDCFGLTRHALHYVFGGPLLDSFAGLTRDNAGEMTNKFNHSVSGFQQCSAQSAAIACCFHKTAQGDILHHVGICIDSLNVMHTSAKHGYSVVPVRVFKRLAARVEFYKWENSS